MTGPELTYLWKARKKRQKAHLQAVDGRSYCQAENNGTKFDSQGSKLPEGRVLCMNCESLAEQENGEPRLSMLMGEAI
jgi:hypothetical protein